MKVAKNRCKIRALFGYMPVLIYFWGLEIELQGLNDRELTQNTQLATAVYAAS